MHIVEGAKHVSSRHLDGECPPEGPPRCFFWFFGAQLHHYPGGVCRTRCILPRRRYVALTQLNPDGSVNYECGPCSDSDDDDVKPPAAAPAGAPITRERIIV
jgi:hypothetical protein